MLNRGKARTLLQIVCEIFLISRDIVKSILDPDDKFMKEHLSINGLTNSHVIHIHDLTCMDIFQKRNNIWRIISMKCVAKFRNNIPSSNLFQKYLDFFSYVQNRPLCRPKWVNAHKTNLRLKQSQ